MQALAPKPVKTVPYHCHHCGVEIALTDWTTLRIPGAKCAMAAFSVLICDECKRTTYWRPSTRKAKTLTDSDAIETIKKVAKGLGWE